MKKVMLVAIVICLFLGGCRAKGEGIGVLSSQYDRLDESAFNTLTDTKEWGDESDFLRIIDITDQVEKAHATDFVGDSLKIADERGYALVAHIHNTSPEDQEEVALAISYPTIFRAGEENQVSAILGNTTTTLSDSLTLETERDVLLSPLAQTEEPLAMVMDGKGGGEYQTVSTTTTDGVTTQVLRLGSLKKDETRTVFILFEALAVIQR